MATNADAIKDLEVAKVTLEKQVPVAAGVTGDNLILAVQRVADEIGALVTASLDSANYLPQTNAFKKVTADAKAFITALDQIKTALVVIADVAQVVDKLLSYVK